MNIRRLSIAHHPILRAAVELLESVTIPPPPYLEKGDWRADIAEGPPVNDRPRPEAYRFARLQHPPGLTLPFGVTIASVNYYPAGGAGMGWHTDSVHPGWRVYIGVPLGVERGRFYVGARVGEGEAAVSSFFDETGVATAFVAREGAWHAVRAEGPRLSIGLYFRGATGDVVGLPHPRSEVGES